MPSAEPQMIGRRYILKESLGTGGMGAVYLATDRLTGGSVALKRVIQPDDEHNPAASTGNSQDYRLALAQEFKVLASLRHPNIISVLDYGFDGGTVMAHVGTPSNGLFWIELSHE